MTRSKQILSPLGVICLWLFVAIACTNVPINMEQKEALVKWNVDSLNYIKLNQKLYIYSHSWGIGGAHEQTVISTTPLKVINDDIKKKHLLFYSTALYYKQTTDSLYLYVGLEAMADSLNKLNTKVAILIKPIVNAEEYKYYKLNYKRIGLKALSTSR